MSDGITFRDAPTPPAVEPATINVPEPKPNEVGADVGFKDIEPIEADSGVLKALGIDDEVKNLPPADQENLGEVKNYVMDIMKAKGIMNSQSNFNRTLNDLRQNMGLDQETEPSIVLDRIGGVVKAWKSLSFITDHKEKRAILMRLARLESGKDMNKEVYRQMEKYKVWE